MPSGLGPRDSGILLRLDGYPTRRFPTWMWRNTAVVDFVEWLRAHNARSGEGGAVGFFG
ncbi:MAG: erythromycin esterase family protein, partial [Actinobacteria bacterium]|nr:erythromycin esterase family protein [Actinomycetota bacterium]